MNVTLILVILLVLLLTGTPISIALGMTVLTFLALFSSFSIDTVDIVSQRLFTGLESFAIMAVPFFVLSGTFLTDGGIARRIIRFALALVGWMHGGLAMAAILACTFFATISGSSPATVVAIGSIMLPAMIKHGYPKRFSVGVIATSGSLGILIPPSIVMIIYAVSTSESAGKLFIAGIVPGILLAAVLMLVTYVTARKKNFPTLPRASGREIWESFKDAFWGLMLVVIVMGGIYGGIFTPTEAAAVSAVYAFIAAVFIYRGLKLREVPQGPAVGGEYKRNAALHHHQCHPVFIPADFRADSASAVAMGRRPAAVALDVSDGRQRRACWWRASSWSPVRSS